jgi:kynurenine formamidase
MRCPPNSFWPGAVLASCLAALAAAGCGPTDASGFDLSTARVIELTHPFDRESIYWPTSPSRFELTVASHGVTPGGWFYEANLYSAPEHGGTHLDAPIHFAEGRRTVEQIPVASLIAPAVVVDVRAKAAADPDYALAPADVEAWEAAHGPIPAGSIVLLWTGWAERWPNVKAYLGDDTPGEASNLHFPSYGLEAARLLVEKRQVAAIGVDTASIDPGAALTFPVHRMAFAAEVPGLENVGDLSSVPATGAWVVAMPMLIRGGSGAPLRIVALVPRGAAG